ncbi:MAG: sortase [Clostridiales bacterium]|jgi:hypothetical protein|nr:sortase [Clostridiales bacterium]
MKFDSRLRIALAGAFAIALLACAAKAGSILIDCRRAAKLYGSLRARAFFAPDRLEGAPEEEPLSAAGPARRPEAQGAAPSRQPGSQPAPRIGGEDGAGAGESAARPDARAGEAGSAGAAYGRPAGSAPETAKAGAGAGSELGAVARARTRAGLAWQSAGVGSRRAWLLGQAGWEVPKTADRLPTETPEPALAAYGQVYVDFAALREENPDCAGWLWIDGLGVSYPVMHSEDEGKYLSTAFDGRRSGGGSLFLDSRNSPGFGDPHSVIYGHNMRDDSMFGQLDAYGSQEYFDSHPFIYLFTPDGSFAYRVFSHYVTTYEMDSYRVDFSGDSGDPGDLGDIGGSGDSGSSGDLGGSGDSGDSGDLGGSGGSGGSGDSGGSGGLGESGDVRAAVESYISLLSSRSWQKAGAGVGADIGAGAVDGVGAHAAHGAARVLTLSTCVGDDYRRRVVHAALIGTAPPAKRAAANPDSSRAELIAGQCDAVEFPNMLN